MYRSRQTQKIVNYFDSSNVRTRENPVGIDSQLVNCAGVALDDAYLRYNREIKALQLPYCPTGLDNNGVYYSANIDPSYSLASDATTLNTVVGIRDTNTYTLTPYNDLLPIPAGYELDSNRVNIQLETPLLTTFTGVGNNQTGEYLLLTNTLNQKLPITNRISFWLYNTFQPNLSITIEVYGSKYPQSPWNSSFTQDVETINITSEGYAETLNAWVFVKKIVVRNLPPGGLLNCNSINFNNNFVLDSTRPVSLPAFRDQTFDCYWGVSTSDNLLKEYYHLDNLSGMVYQQSYNLSVPITNVAVEPNTWGLIAGGGTSLYYLDRRELLPSLSGTGLIQEPSYGLDIFYDVSTPGNTRYVIIRPIPYKNAVNVIKYQINVQLPDGTLITLLPNGSYVPFGNGSTWQSGAAQTIKFPLVETGAYIFSINSVDTNNNTTSDVFPYGNFDVSSLIKQSYDLSSLIVNIEGISYDFLGNLWIYDGNWAIPIKPYYNGYVIDPIGRVIYMTDLWDQITYS